MAAVLIIPTKFTAVDKFTPVMRKMTAATSSFTTKARAGFEAVGIAERKMRMGIRRLIPSFGSLSKQMLQFASAAILITGIMSSINIIKDFEQAQADLSAVMNTTPDQLQLLADDSKRLGAITAKSATEVVALQEAFARLGFTTPEIINMTEATISGSIAMNAELAQTAELTGAVVKTFRDFSSIDAPDILDKMTLSTQKSALNFEKLQTALPIVGGAANAAGVSFEQTLALLGKLSDAGIDASSSANALKRIFIESKAAGLNYNQILTKISTSSDKLTMSVDEFGVRASVSSAILSEKLGETADLTNKLSDATIFQGTASDAAGKRLDTFSGSLTLLGSKWESILLDTNETTGALGLFRTMIDLLTNNLKGIVNIVLIAIAVWSSYKLIMWAVRTATIAYNFALGVSTALQGGSAMALRASSAAMIGYKVVLGIYTGVQWLANAALWAFPLTWIVAAIIAVIAAIVALIVYWEDIVNWIKTSDNWFAKLIRFSLKPLMLLFKIIGAVIEWISEKFSDLVEWVKTSDNWFAKFIRFSLEALALAFQKIGEAMDWVGDKFKQFRQWMAEVTIGPLMDIMEFFTGKDLSNMKLSLFEQMGGGESVNPEATVQRGITNREESVTKSSADVNINLPPGLDAEIESDTGDIPVKLTPTM